MNKNPDRPKNMDEIISNCFNQKQSEEPRYKKIEREIIGSIFG